MRGVSQKCGAGSVTFRSLGSARSSPLLRIRGSTRPYEGGQTETPTALDTPFLAEPLPLSLRFSRRIRSFQADPWGGPCCRPASFSSRQMSSVFGKFAVFRTESRPATRRKRSAAADLLGEPPSTRAQHQSLSEKHFAPSAGGQNFLKRGCAARALFSPSELHRNARARDTCGPSRRARDPRHVVLPARRSVRKHIKCTPLPARTVVRRMTAASSASWHSAAATRHRTADCGQECAV